MSLPSWPWCGVRADRSSPMRIDSGFVEPVRFRCCRRPTTNLTRPRTRSSNPVPSSGESTNHRFLGGGAASTVTTIPITDQSSGSPTGTKRHRRCRSASNRMRARPRRCRNAQIAKHICPGTPTKIETRLFTLNHGPQATKARNSGHASELSPARPSPAVALPNARRRSG